MFKCCVCNKSSKKSKKEKKLAEEEEESEREVKLEAEKKLRNGVRSSASLERINAEVKSESDPTNKSLPNSPLENSESREKSDATIDPESTKKIDELAAGKSDSISSLHDNLSEKSSSLRQSNEINLSNDNKNCNDSASKQKSFIYTNPIGVAEAPAFIERTLVDGSDEDGDDSVFEASFSNETEKVEIQAPVMRTVPKWLSQEEDDEKPSEGCDGMQEPPATPVARDELALRRHRFFSDLLQAARNTSEHRVHFDPLGPVVHAGCETEDREEHLEDLVTRLENVTRRLESVPTKLLTQTQETAVQTKTPSPKRTHRSNGELSTLQTSSGNSNNLDTMSVSNFEDLLAGPVKDYLNLSQKIGGDVATHSKLVEKAFQTQSQFIKTASSRPAPTSQSEQVSLLGPTSTSIQEIQEYREKNRGSQFFNHLSAISESIPALGWVAVSPTPAPYVKEMNDAGQFYTNRVLKDWKEKDKTHVEWCKAWVQTLSDLQQYVRKHHTTGLVWAKTGSVPVPPPPGGMPPPPPPSMPLGDVTANVNDDRSALFAQINQGENITRSLKKVTSDMQTHKNSSLRTGPAPFKAPVTTNSGNFKTVPSANLPIDKPPVFTRDGKKWLVEYHKGNKDLLVENAEMNNVVYMFRCQDSTLIVKGKINSIVIDSCRKSSIVFDSLVSSIEFVNCQSVQMQVLGKVPTISIDKTDGCQMYLSPDSLDVALISSKSSEMNVMVPKGNGDYTEHPVPEQFKTTIGRNGLSTTAVDSLG
ncbi:adenylyl cyclase-associated protein 1 [Venturia canescens]|uniref:adenylyl cyclase-associated protein 1 n=1 Tax=Venturia canescens TaxID=32260 RepID=UPI001C9CAFCF|nr:adenylyl cyclase-associated protein 1 [Venturia canescens]